MAEVTDEMVKAAVSAHKAPRLHVNDSTIDREIDMRAALEAAEKVRFATDVRQRWTGEMDDSVAVEIAEAIMREQNVDNLTGFGGITIGRIKAMLMNATKTGYLKGYSDGWTEGEGQG